MQYNTNAEYRLTVTKLCETNKCTCKKSYRLLKFYVYSSKSCANKYVGIITIQISIILTYGVMLSEVWVWL